MSPSIGCGRWGAITVIAIRGKKPPWAKRQAHNRVRAEPRGPPCYRDGLQHRLEIRMMLGSRSFHRRFVMVLVTVVCGALSRSAIAQEDSEESPYRPGLIATYTADAKSVERTDEVITFDWQDAACDPRLPVGQFTATWKGRLWVRGAGSFRLQCYVQGEVAVKLAGQTIITGHVDQPQWLASPTLELEFDY